MDEAELDKLKRELTRLTNENAKLRRGGEQLGKIIDRYGLMMIEVTKSQDITDADGDGDWEVVEERLRDLPRALEAAQDEIERLISEKEALREQLDGDDEGDIREMLAEIDRLAEPGATCPASDDKGLAGALLAVLRLHKRLNAGICVECSVWDAHVEWPCVTVTTLTEALGCGAS